MDAPFKKEKKEEIGLDMTPGRLRKPHYTPTAKGLDDFLKPPKTGGRSGLRFSSVAVEGGDTGTQENACSTSKPSTGNGSNQAMVNHTAAVKTGTPRLENAGKSTGNGTKRRGEKFVYTENRRCITKIDYRGYKSGSVRNTGKNADFVSKRLAPFAKSNGGTGNGAQVGYLGRTGALEGDLFSCIGNTFKIYNNDEAISMFSGDPTISVILSPEDPGADLVELAKRFMKDIYSAHADAEPSFWCAAIHGNTNHKHVHIIVSTIGKNRMSEALIRPSYVHSGQLQKDVGALLTEIQGPRTWKEIIEADKRKRNILHLTGIDRDMINAAVKMEDGTSVLTLKDLPSTKKEKASRRLQTLKKFGLVESSGNRDGVWTFQPGAISRLSRAEYSEHFGLTENELNNSILDIKYTPDYNGIILESVQIDKNTMLFMIRDENGHIHLRKEKIKNSEDAARYTALEDVSIQTVRDGFKELRARSRS